MTSLHWRYDPAFIRTLVAPGLEGDSWEGDAWEGDAWVSVMRNLVEGLAWGVGMGSWQPLPQVYSSARREGLLPPVGSNG